MTIEQVGCSGRSADIPARACSYVPSARRSAAPSPASPQLQARVAELSAAQAANAAKLAELKGGGARLVSADDVQKAEKVGRHCLRANLVKRWDCKFD